MPTSCITVRRSSEDGVYTYYVAEAYPPGQVDKVFLWRTLEGYFGEITLQKGGPSIRFDGYNHRSILKNDLITCLHKELQCPELIKVPSAEVGTQRVLDRSPRNASVFTITTERRT